MSQRSVHNLAPSLQGRLSLLVTAVLIFGAGLAVWLIWQGYRNERHAMERHLSDTARALNALLETELGKRESFLRGIATSPELLKDDLRSLEANARNAGLGADEWIVLADAGSHQLVNTGLPEGAPLPQFVPDPDELRTLEQGKTFYSNFSIGPATGRRMVSISMGVRSNSGRRLTLSSRISPKALVSAVSKHRIGEGWLVSVVDRNHIISARTRDADQWVGKPMSQRMRELIRGRTEGVATTVTLDGIPSLTAFNRSAITGYTVIVAAPRKELFAGAQNLAIQALAVALAVGVAATLFAMWVGRSIVTGMVALVRATEKLGRGERIEVRETGITEIDVVSNSLANASRTLATREEALERARDEALAASRAKDEFLASLSHELRTPLNPVLLMASDGANDPANPPALQEIFQAIARNVTLEARLIDDLLDLTRISSGKLSLHLQPVPIDALLRDTVETLRRTVEEKPLRLSLSLDCGGAATTGDPTRLRQVFWNLLNNAIKFTPPDGTVSISSRVDAASERLVIEVADSGMGMSERELARLFQRFSQGDHAAQGSPSTYGGLGLGLVIARNLVEMHQGEIHAASAGRGRGSVFTVRLPLLYQVPVAAGKPAHRSSQPAPQAPAPAAKTKRRILLVEDHKPTLVTLERLLNRRGYEVSAASTARSAVELAASGTYDLVISDIGLPDKTGYDLMRELGQNYRLRGIAMSGYGSDSDRAQGREAGFILHLTKPVDIASLEEALGKVFGAQN